MSYATPDRTILVTGGAGFIGSAYCRLLVQNPALRIVNLDRLSHPAPPDALAAINGMANYRFVEGDIADRALVAAILAEEHVDAIVNLAAEGHADRSITGRAVVLETNVTGTFHLLETALEHWRGLMPDKRAAFRFHHVSTDEAFGDPPSGGHPLDPAAIYRPASPYAASKAAADHLARAWHLSFGLPVVLSSSSNNYGPFQSLEQLIPRTIRNALAGLPLPVYGTGAHLRDWLHVDDHARALLGVLECGQVGETYPIGGREEHSTIAVVAMICDLIDRIEPRPDGRKHRSLITFMPDRRRQDRHRAIDSGRTERALEWRPLIPFRDGLIALIDERRDKARRRDLPAEALAG